MPFIMMTQNIKLSITNKAFRALGVEQIQSLDSGEAFAGDAKKAIDHCISKVLSAKPFRAGIKNSGTLAQIAKEDNTYRWFYKPVDCIRIVHVYNTSEVAIFNNEIRCKASSSGDVNIDYISNNIEESTLPDILIDVVGLCLAVELCEIITGSSSERVKLMRDYEIALAKAFEADQAGQIRHGQPMSSWLDE